jgi:hypothetical protein
MLLGLSSDGDRAFHYHYPLHFETDRNNEEVILPRLKKEMDRILGDRYLLLTTATNAKTKFEISIRENIASSIRKVFFDQKALFAFPGKNSEDKINLSTEKDGDNEELIPSIDGFTFFPKELLKIKKNILCLGVSSNVRDTLYSLF